MEVLEAFGRGERGTDAWAARWQSIADGAGQWRVGELDGRIVSAIHVPAGAVWFGGSRFTWADVGEVSVLPGMQGQGIGTVAMRDAVAWQAERGVSVSRLGGLLRFYRRAGYEPFPRQYIEFPISDKLAAGASRLSFKDLMTPRDGEAGRVRPVDLSTDAEAVREVAAAHNRCRNGCRVLGAPLDGVRRGHRGIVYERARKVCGFASFATYRHDGGAFEGGLSAYVMAYLPDCAPALEAMVKHMLCQAHDAGARRMTALLPPDAATLRDLDTLGVNYNVCQEFGRIAGNMIRIISLRQLLGEISDELRRRVEPIRWRGRMCFDLGDQQATLRIHDAGVEVPDDTGASDADVVLTFTHAELLRMVLGVMPADWMTRIGAAHPAYAALAAMFPPVAGGFTT